MNTQTIKPEDAAYPEGVRELPRVATFCRGAPPELHLRGTLPRGPAVSIVGSRDATAPALRFTANLAATLAAAGWWVVSGGAYGVDAAAHEGALSVPAPTVAVVTGGLDGVPYPRGHAALFARVQASGGLLSLQPDGVSRRRFHFLQRNAVMVALTSATIVVHASADGGATKAAKAASALGRPVFHVPESPWTKARGTLEALRGGATPLWCIEDAIPTLAPFASRMPDGLTPELGAVWRACSHQPQHVDALRQHAGLERAAIAEALLMLVLDGLLEEGPAGHYRRARMI